MRSDLRFEYDIILNLKLNDKQKEIAELERKRAFTRAVKYNIFSNAENKEKAVLEKNIEELLVDLTSNTENVFSFEFFIVIKAISKKELNAHCKDVLLQLNHLEGATGLEEDMPNLILYTNGCQVGTLNMDHERTEKLWTSRLSCILPLFGPPEGVGEPLMLFRNSYDSLTYFNPLSPKYIARNGIVTGTTGSGKSFITNLITLGYFAKDPILIIVDIGGSYKKTINIFNGDYFELSFENSINPFATQNIAKRELFWSAILQVMLKDETKNGISNNEKYIIDKMIEYVIEHNIETPIISDFIDALKNIKLESELTLLRDDLIRCLTIWTSGQKGQLLNQRQTSLKIEKNIMGFDLKGLNDYPEIMEVIMFYLANVIWEKIEAQRSQKKLIIFDEVWQQFLSKQGSELLEELYRTIRKYDGSIWSISQSISDFADSPIAVSILQNIQFFYIMKQSDGTDYQTLGKLLNLSEEDVAIISTLESQKGLFSEAFIKTPDLKFLAKIVPSPFEYWLATTDGEDMPLYYNTLKEHDYNVYDTIELLSKKYPNGYSNRKKEKEKTK